MKLSKLSAKNYRSLRDETIELNDLNLFIGANASGKSTNPGGDRYGNAGRRRTSFEC